MAVNPPQLQRTELLGRIRGALFSPDPDTASLEAHLAQELHVPPATARDLIYHLALQLNQRLFPPVTKLELIHTEGCNLACTYCFEKDMLGVRRMSREVMIGAIDILLDYCGDATDLYVTHFGGEPTLNFAAIQAATEYAEEHAARRGKSVHFDMTSNGVLITDAMASYCASHRIMVLLSIDGLQGAHDRFRRDRRGRGTFDQAMRGLRILKRHQPWIGVKMTVMPDNAGRLFRDVTGLHALGVNQFVIGYATGIEWPSEAMHVYAEELSRVFRWYAAGSRDDVRIAEFEERDEDAAYFGCQAGRNSVTAAVNGEISPCSKVLALNNRNLLAKLGDVRYGLTHLKNRADLVGCSQLRAACDSRGITGEFRGGCFASNYEQNRDLFAPSMQDHAFSLVRRSVCSGCSAHARSPSR